MVQSKNNIKHILIGFCIGIICLVIIPISINKLILKPRLFETAGTDVDWLLFWSGYLGAIISAGVAFAILCIQRQDNKKQNEENRNENKKQNEENRTLQINVLKHQQKTQWLNELKSKCLEYYLGFDINVLVDFKDSINISATTQKDSFDTLKELCEKKNSSAFSFGLMFPPQEYLDEKEYGFLATLKDYSDSYNVALYDIIWLCQLIDKNIELGSCDKQIELHRNNCKFNWGKESKAIEYFENGPTNLFESADSKIFYKNAINYCITTNINIKEVQKTLVALIDYEQEVINQILLDNKNQYI